MEKNSRTFKTVKDPAYLIPTVKVQIKGGIATVVRKDKKIRIEIVDMDIGDDNERLGKSIVIPAYAKV